MAKRSKANTSTEPLPEPNANTLDDAPPQVPQTPRKKGSKAKKNKGKKNKSKAKELSEHETSSDDGPIPQTLKTPGKPPWSKSEKGYCDDCECISCKDKRKTGCPGCSCPECKNVYQGEESDDITQVYYCKHCPGENCSTIREKPGRCEDCTQKECECHSGTSDLDRYRPLEKIYEREGTPAVRDDHPLSQEQKDKVRSAALKAASPMKFAKGTDKTGFCLITLLSGPAAGAQFCHIIAHSTTNDDLKMSKLEYALGMKYMELNLNSHYNILLLEPSFHWTFDQAHWALIPLDIAFINRMNKARFTVDSPLEKLYQGYEEHAWSYLFLPFPPMRDRYIVQCNPEGVESGPSKANPVVPPHYYPQHLPVIKSHIRPHFVIYDLAKKLLHDKRDEPELRELMGGWEEYDPVTISTCLHLYDKWTKVELPSDFKGPLPINDGTAADVAADVVGSETGRSERRPGLRPKSLLQSITSLKKTDSGKSKSGSQKPKRVAGSNQARFS